LVLAKDCPFIPKSDVYVLALTGTEDKFHTLEEIFNPLGVLATGVLGLSMFQEAGNAEEPVTTDCVCLMLGKQQNQKTLFLNQLRQNAEMRNQYDGKYLILSSNDINTTIDEVPLTKSELQKKTELSESQYAKLITASLKYLSMKKAGIKLEYTWDDMQANWELIDKCLSNDWKDRVFLPIDYQAIDMFDLQELIVSKKTNLILQKRGPTVAVINRAYATLELDWRNGNELINEIVVSYLSANWRKSDFTPDRYPLGIRQKDLLTQFIFFGQHVLYSDYECASGENLKELYPINREEVNESLKRMDQMLNGFSAVSVEIAQKYFENRKQDWEYLYVITRKPGNANRVDRIRLSKKKIKSMSR